MLGQIWGQCMFLSEALSWVGVMSPYDLTNGWVRARVICLCSILAFGTFWRPDRRLQTLSSGDHHDLIWPGADHDLIITVRSWPVGTYKDRRASTTEATQSTQGCSFFKISRHLLACRPGTQTLRRKIYSNDSTLPDLILRFHNGCRLGAEMLNFWMVCIGY